MALNLNRLGALILGLNTQEFRPKTRDEFPLPTKDFKDYLRYDASSNSKVRTVFRELLFVLDQTIGGGSGLINLRGINQPNPAPSGTGTIYYDFTAARFRVSESGRPYFDAFPREGCRAYNTANISINNNTVTALTFDSTRFDPFNMFTLTGSQININRAGRYHFGGCIEFAADINGYRQLGLRLNGTTFIAINNKTPLGGIADRMTIDSIYEFVSGDYVELIVYQDSGVALNIVAAGNYSPEFYCARVHDQPA